MPLVGKAWRCSLEVGKEIKAWARGGNVPLIASHVIKGRYARLLREKYGRHCPA